MDRGAAAREKNGATTSQQNDRDNQIPKPTPRRPNGKKEAPSGFSANRAQKIARWPLTQKALSGTGTQYLTPAFSCSRLAWFWLGTGFLRFQDTTNKILQTVHECQTAQRPTGTPVFPQVSEFLFGTALAIKALQLPTIASRGATLTNRSSWILSKTPDPFVLSVLSRSLKSGTSDHFSPFP